MPHCLFFRYLKDKDIDFEFIQRLTWDHCFQDYCQPIVIQPPLPIPSIPSAVSTLNSQESQHPGENQSLMTETRVIQPFVPSPPSSSDQSHEQTTTAVKTTPSSQEEHLNIPIPITPHWKHFQSTHLILLLLLIRGILVLLQIHYLAMMLLNVS